MTISVSPKLVPLQKYINKKKTNFYKLNFNKTKNPLFYRNEQTFEFDNDLTNLIPNRDSSNPSRRNIRLNSGSNPLKGLLGVHKFTQHFIFDRNDNLHIRVSKSRQYLLIRIVNPYFSNLQSQQHIQNLVRWWQIITNLAIIDTQRWSSSKLTTKP